MLEKESLDSFICMEVETEIDNTDRCSSERRISVITYLTPGPGTAITQKTKSDLPGRDIFIVEPHVSLMLSREYIHWSRAIRNSPRVFVKCRDQ